MFIYYYPFTYECHIKYTLWTLCYTYKIIIMKYFSSLYLSEIKKKKKVKERKKSYCRTKTKRLQ